MEIDSSIEWRTFALYSHSESSSLRSVFTADVPGLGGGGIMLDMLSSRFELDVAVDSVTPLDVA